MSGPSQHDVAGLHVPVDDASIVGERQGLSHRLANLGHTLWRKRSLSIDELREGLSLDQLHHDERRVTVDADVVQGDDVRVAQRSHRSFLAAETGDSSIV